jgi:hypothetical protein
MEHVRGVGITTPSEKDRENTKESDHKESDHKGNVFSKIKQGISRLIGIVQNAIKSIISKFKSNKKSKIVTMITTNKQSCVEIGKKLQQISSTVHTEYFVQEYGGVDKGDLWKDVAKRAGNDLNVVGNKILNKVNDAAQEVGKEVNKAAYNYAYADKIAFEEGRAAAEAERRAAEIQHMKNMNAVKSPSQELVNAAQRGANIGALTTGKFPVGFLIGAGVGVGIAICAAIFIAIAKNNNYELPSPDNAKTICDDLNKKCLELTSLANALNKNINVNKNFTNVKLDKETVTIIRKMKSWRDKYDKNKDAFKDKYAKFYMNKTQERLLTDAVYFYANGNAILPVILSSLMRNTTKLKNAVESIDTSNNPSRIGRLCQQLIDVSKQCAEFVSIAELGLSVGRDMVQNMEISMSNIDKINNRKIGDKR